MPLCKVILRNYDTLGSAPILCDLSNCNEFEQSPAWEFCALRHALCCAVQALCSAYSFMAFFGFWCSFELGLFKFCLF